jgi:MoaA/NifB/PqqE/SkfB family radical SAM enzyme
VIVLKKGEIVPDAIEVVVDPEKDALSRSRDFDVLVMFRITDFCAYRCPYCHWNRGSHYRLDDVRSVVDVLSEAYAGRRVYYYFHGGEATSHPGLEDVLRHIRASDPRTFVELQTNGFRGEEYLSALDSLGLVDTYSFSYHHSEVEDFESLFRGMEALESRVENVDVMFQTYLDEGQRAAFRRNVLRIVDVFGKRVEATYGYCGFEARKTDDMIDFYLEIEDRIHRAEYRLTTGDQVFTFNKSELFVKGVDCSGMICEAGRSYVAVNGNGDYAPCGSYLVRGMRDPSFPRLDNMLRDRKKFLVRTRVGTVCGVDYCGGEWYLGQRRKG